MDWIKLNITPNIILVWNGPVALCEQMGLGWRLGRPYLHLPAVQYRQEKGKALFFHPLFYIPFQAAAPGEMDRSPNRCGTNWRNNGTWIVEKQWIKVWGVSLLAFRTDLMPFYSLKTFKLKYIIYFFFEFFTSH